MFTPFLSDFYYLVPKRHSFVLHFLTHTSGYFLDAIIMLILTRVTFPHFMMNVGITNIDEGCWVGLTGRDIIFNEC